MNYYRYGGNYGYNQGYIRPRLFSGAIKNLIIANVVIFLVMVLFRAHYFFAVAFGLVPNWVWSRGFIWQLFTYMFIHANFAHIFWNMFVLWMFGTEIENYWGKREFYKYYFITGIGSGIITTLFSLNSKIPVVGASGAIYGVLVAFGMMFPNRYLYIYFLIPIRAKYFVIFMGLITFFSTLTPGSSNISHLTHLGGIVIGYIYLRRNHIAQLIRFKFPSVKIKNPFKNIVRKASKDEDKDFHYDTDETLREEVDRILDKISKEGYDSLTEEEKRTLFLASKYFADKSN
jgi:membrane associated rhomboid family serine protease